MFISPYYFLASRAPIFGISESGRAQLYKKIYSVNVLYCIYIFLKKKKNLFTYRIQTIASISCCKFVYNRRNQNLF